MDVRKKYERYASLYSKAGVLDDSITGMEWMERDYDSRTLKEVTERCSASEFFNEFLTILTIGTPNLMMLGHALGIFDWKNNGLVSVEILNKLISEIAMYPLSKISAYKDELGRITIKFTHHIFSKQDVLKSLTSFKIEIENENDFGLITIPRIVKRTPLDEDVVIIAEVKIKSDWVSTIDIRYE